MEDFKEYPKVMHGPDSSVAVVDSKEAEESLGSEWVSGHAYWEKKAMEAAQREAVKSEESVITVSHEEEPKRKKSK